MASPVDQIPVLRGHLLELHAALEAAMTYHGAKDLAYAARNVGGTSRPSNLTKRLEAAFERVEGYLLTEDHDVREA